MNCPNDGTVLQMTERHGIEIDYCPQCRGVWLDRGELDRIIERAPAPVGVAAPGRRDRWDDDDDDDDDRRVLGRRPARKKKSSFLSELFEFGE